jgi:hypothetical protein
VLINAVKAGLGSSLIPCFKVQGDDALVRLTPAVVARQRERALLDGSIQGDASSSR